jgi:hypothetical protein
MARSPTPPTTTTVAFALLLPVVTVALAYDDIRLRIRNAQRPTEEMFKNANQMREHNRQIEALEKQIEALTQRLLMREQSAPNRSSSSSLGGARAVLRPLPPPTAHASLIMKETPPAVTANEQRGMGGATINPATYDSLSSSDTRVQSRV